MTERSPITLADLATSSLWREIEANHDALIAVLHRAAVSYTNVSRAACFVEARAIVAALAPLLDDYTLVQSYVHCAARGVA